MGSPNPKVVVIGWHGANWKSIHPLVDAGLMPNLRSLIERGLVGNVKAAGPGDPAILWTTAATGKPADQHGILSALECHPLSGRLRLARGSRRSVKAVWNIAMQSGLVTHVAGWYAASPAEELNGSSVANEFVVPTGAADGAWPVRAGTIFPERIAEKAAGLRLHPSELRIEELLPFIPTLAGIDPKQDNRPLVLADILAREISMHSIVTWLMEHEPWNLMMIGWHALGRACHQFMPYAPPQMSHSSEEFACYSSVIAAVHRFQDMLLGRLIELAGPEATLLLVSPTGYRCGAERPAAPTLRQLPGSWYRPYGVLCMAGSNIVQDELVHGVTTFDIAPTILSVLGLPPGADMPGRVIEQAFSRRPAADRVPTWEAVPGDCGMSAPESEEDEQAAAAAVAELLGEGYSEPERPSAAAVFVKRERLLNTILVQLAAGRYQEARPALIELATESPQDARIRLWLAHCHLLAGDQEACRDAMHGIARKGAGGALACLIETQLELRDGNTAGALTAVRRAESLGADLPIVNYAAAILYMRLASWDTAEKRLRRVIALDPSFQPAYSLLSTVLSARGDRAQAAEPALAGLEIDYSSALAHLALGWAMAGSGHGDEALNEFEKSLALDPGLQEARAWVTALRNERAHRCSMQPSEGTA